MPGYFSIGKAPRGNSASNLVPGPNHYDPKVPAKQSAPQYKMGTEQRIKIYTTSVPGPGQYHPQAVQSQKGKHTMRGRNVKEKKRDVPGPGSYSAQHNDKMVAYSMAKKIQPPPQDITPGPGSYDIFDRQEGIYNEKKQSKSTEQNHPIETHCYFLTGQNTHGPFYNAREVPIDQNGLAYSQADHLTENYKHILKNQEKTKWTNTQWQDVDALHLGREQTRKTTQRTWKQNYVRPDLHYQDNCHLSQPRILQEENKTKGVNNRHQYMAKRKQQWGDLDQMHMKQVLKKKQG